MCNYCSLSETEKNFIFGTTCWMAFLSWDQRYLGRCVIFLKRHCEDLAELKREEWGDFILLVSRMEKVMRRAFDARMFNWSCLMNNAYQESPPRPHVHWHLKPRYDKSVEFAGLIFEDKEFGHHYSREEQKVSEEAQQEIIKRIREFL